MSHTFSSAFLETNKCKQSSATVWGRAWVCISFSQSAGSWNSRWRISTHSLLRLNLINVLSFFQVTLVNKQWAIICVYLCLCVRALKLPDNHATFLSISESYKPWAVHQMGKSINTRNTPPHIHTYYLCTWRSYINPPMTVEGSGTEISENIYEYKSVSVWKTQRFYNGFM